MVLPSRVSQYVPYARVWRVASSTNDFEGPASSASADSTPGRPSGPSGQRLGRSDWVDAALRELAVGGLGSLSIERLATALGATKGSFYWHFTNRSALIDAALAEWERRDTDQLIQRASEINDPRERLRWLFRVVFSDAGGVGIDTALLADAKDPAVAAALARVATKRLAYIEAQYKQMGTKAAAHRAVLTYTAFIGLAQLRRSTPSLAPQGRRSTNYLTHITRWLID
jgi:AcrR family transcriptional regulator